MMKNEKKYNYLLKNFGILTISNFGSKILAFLLVPIYTRYLSTQEYGTFDLYITTITLFVPCLTLNIAEAVFRFSLDRNYNIKEVWSIGFKYSIYACLLFSALVMMNHIIELIPMFEEYSFELVALFISTFFYDLFSKFARGIDNILSTGIAGIINSFILLVLNILFLTQLDFGLRGYLWAYCLSYIIPIIYYCFSLKIWKYYTLKTGKTSSKDMVRYSAPLVFDTVGWWVNNASDRYIVTWICGIAINGIYSVSYKIPSILNMINSIFGQAWTLSAVKEFENESLRNDFYTNIYKIYNCGMVVVCSILIILNKVIAKIIFGINFYDAWKYAPFLMISVVFSALMTVMGGILLAAKQSKELGIITTIGAIFNIVFNIILIHFVGAIGAAISTMLTYILVWSIRFIKMKDIVKISIKLHRDIFSYIILVMQAIILFFDINMTMLYGIELVLFICIIFFYRHDIMNIVESLFQCKVK